MFFTRNDISYRAAPYLKQIARIPKGTVCTPARNLPDGATAEFWIQSWIGMSEEAKSWERNYGFLVDAEDVIEMTSGEHNFQNIIR